MEATLSVQTLGHGDHPDIRRLIQRAQQGDKKSLGQLIEQYRGLALRIALGFVQNKESAEEIVQQASLNVVRFLGGFDGKYKFSTWFIQIIKNESLNFLRKHRGETLVAISDEDVEMLLDTKLDPALDCLMHELREYLRLAFLGLPEEYKLVLTLRYLEQRSQEEICTITGLKIGTVKSRIHRGGRRVQATLKHSCPHLLKLFGIF